jgi:hypothetical protein
MKLNLSPVFILISTLIELTTASFPAQQPMTDIFDHQPSNTLAAAVHHPTGHARCPSKYHWTCATYNNKLYCFCTYSPDLVIPEDGIQSNEKFLNSIIASAVKVKALQILTEFEPGNNDTRVELFTLHCEEEELIVCPLHDAGFKCGCRLKADFPTLESSGNDQNDIPNPKADKNMNEQAEEDFPTSQEDDLIFIGVHCDHFCCLRPPFVSTPRCTCCMA